MKTEEMIEIAKECCSYPVNVSDYHWCGEGEFIFNNGGLAAFAQRIEQPLQHKINELRFDVEYQQRQIEELEQQVKPLQQRIEKITEKSYSGLNAKNKQIEQLREALQGFLDAFNGGYEPSLQTVFIASKALEQTK